MHSSHFVGIRLPSMATWRRAGIVISTLNVLARAAPANPIASPPKNSILGIANTRNSDRQNVSPELKAIGFSPFAVESIDPAHSMLPDCYRALGLLNDEIVACRDNNALGAFVLTRRELTAQLELGGFRLNCAHDFTWEWSGPGRLEADWPKAGAMVLAIRPDEFLVIGSGIVVTFAPPEATGERVGILSIEALEVRSDRTVKRRRLNGDESHQGRHLRIPAQTFGVQSIRLYRYH